MVASYYETGGGAIPLFQYSHDAEWDDWLWPRPKPDRTLKEIEDGMLLRTLIYMFAIVYILATVIMWPALVQ